MEHRKLKDQDEDGDPAGGDLESVRGRALSVPVNPLSTLRGGPGDRQWKRKSIVTLALTVLTSSQAILIVWSKRAGQYEYSVTTANFLVETLKCALSLAFLVRIWNREGVTEDNRLSTTLNEVSVYPIPAALYLVKNLLQYYIFAYVDAPGYQILKNLNIISTGVLYRIILKRELSEIQWAAFILLSAGCTTAQLNSNSDRVMDTPVQGWIMAIVMALLSGFAGVYTEGLLPWILSDHDSHDSKSCIEWYCCVHGDEVCRQYCKGLFDFSGNASDSSSLSVSLRVSSVPSLLPWFDCCLGLDILALHWEAEKIGTPLL